MTGYKTWETHVLFQPGSKVEGETNFATLPFVTFHCA